MSAVSSLDNRLFTIASMVRHGVSLADIGCDHGLLITALCLDNVITGGIACDINPQPLQKSIHRITMLGLSAQLSCRLGDGLSPIGENEADDLVIAGMGGELIRDILSHCPWKQNPQKHFLLQPMTKAPLLRDWLLRNGFEISQEQGCMAANKCYTVMCVRYTGRIRELSAFDTYLYSGELLRSPSPQSAAVITKAATSVAQRADGLQASSPAEARELALLSQQLLESIKGW